MIAARVGRARCVTESMSLVASTSLQWLTTHLLPKAIAASQPSSVAAAAIPTCPECKAALEDADGLYARYAICAHCGHHLSTTARARIAQLADVATFKPIGQAIQSTDVIGFVDDQPYALKIQREQQKIGLLDAIVIGRCRIQHIEAVLAVLDFHFMGGSMGSVVGEQIAYAFEYALQHRLPVVTVVNSGGARMQEGTLSLMQMPKTAAAVRRFHNAGLFYCSVLASPTTGGVFASFANLGDILLAEPRATIGFAGPRVAEQVLKQRLPEGSHRAESLLAAGMIDAIVPRDALPGVLGMLLQATMPVKHARHLPRARSHAMAEVREHTAWESVQLARHPDRPTALDYIHALSPRFFTLSGDRCYGDDPTIVAGLGTIAGTSGANDRVVMFIGEQRRYPEDNARIVPQKPKPEGYRKALRVMRLAAQLGCPLITFIDTIGADPSAESERHGLAWSMAQCLAEMSDLPIPIITAVIGEGASGGAVVLAVADHILMLQEAIYEVIAPEGAATIIYRDASRAEEIAEKLKLTAADCLRLGIVDTVIPEPVAGAHTDPAVMFHRMRQELHTALGELDGFSTKQLLARRYRKFRHQGRFTRQRLLNGRQSARFAGPA